MHAVVHAVVYKNGKGGIIYDSMGCFSGAFGSYFHVWSSYKKN